MESQASGESDPDSTRPTASGRAGPFAGALALFVFLVEVVATVGLKFLLDSGSHDELVPVVVYFRIGFPTLAALLFFATLWLRPQSLHGVGEGSGRRA